MQTLEWKKVLQFLKKNAVLVKLWKFLGSELKALANVIRFSYTHNCTEKTA